MLPIPPTAITFADDPPPPAVPLVAPQEPLPLPGSRAREKILKERVARGEPTTQPGDVLRAPTQVGFGRRLRNGAHRRECEVVEEDYRGEKARIAPEKSGTAPSTCEGENGWLARRFAALRRIRGLSLGQVAHKAHLPRATIHDIERGRNLSPTMHVLWALADAYGVTLDELVGRS